MTTWPGVAVACITLVLPAAAAVSTNPAPVDVVGTLEVLIADDFEGGRAETSFAVVDAMTGERRRLTFAGRAPEGAQTGMRVRARGVAVGDRLVVAGDFAEAGPAAAGDFEVLAGPEPAAPDPLAVDVRKVLAILVNFTDATVGTSVASVSNRLFSTTDDSVKDFYEECTFGAVTFAGKVVGPVTVNYSYYDGCDVSPWATAAKLRAKNGGDDPDDYDHVVCVLPGGGDCTWAGLGSVGGGSVWVKSWCSAMVYAHELGHNLGMWHASTDGDDNGTVNDEYGDDSDVMGSSLRHPNLPHKRQKNWIPSTKVKTVTTSGTHELAPVETAPANTTRLQGLRLDIDGASQDYYFSYRRKTGYDLDLSSTYAAKVNIHRWNGSGNTLFVRSLGVGDTFDKMSSSGFKVTVVDTFTTGAVVEVLVSGSALTRIWENGDGHMWDNVDRWTNGDIPNSTNENAEFGAEFGSDQVHTNLVNGLSRALHRVGMNGVSPAIKMLHFYDNAPGADGWKLSCGDGTSTLTVSGDPAIKNTYGAHLIEGFVSGTLKLKLGRSGRNQVQVAGSVQVNAAVSGAYTNSALAKTGNGTLVLTGNNTYEGGTELLGGTLAVDSLEALGASYLAIKGESTFRYDGGSESTTRPLWIDDGDGGGGGTIRVTNEAATLTWNPVAGEVSEDLAKDGAGSLTLGAFIKGTAVVAVKAGVLTLACPTNTHSGGVRLEGGTLRIAAAGSLGDAAPVIFSGGGTLMNSDSTITLGAGRQMTLDGDGAFQAGWGKDITVQGRITGDGSRLTISADTTPGWVIFDGASNDYSGVTHVLGNLRLGVNHGIPAGNDALVQTGGVFDLNGYAEALGSLTGGGAVLTGGGALTLGRGGASCAFGGVISEDGSLVKAGTGTVTLTGANTYGGGTVVSNGALMVNNAAGSGTGSGSVQVRDDAQLGGTGTIFGAVSVADGGVLSPGVAVGTLTISNDLALSALSRLEFDLGTQRDLLAVAGGLALGGRLRIADAGGFGPGVYPLIRYGGARSGSLPAVETCPPGFACAVDATTQAGEVRLVAWTAGTSPFGQWQILHFGRTNDPDAAAGRDPDGDGADNASEFGANTNPNDARSVLQLAPPAPSGGDIRLTWTAAGVRTNRVEAVDDFGHGDFVDLSGPIVLPIEGDATTNFLDRGAATGAPARVYRVRVD